MQFVSPEQAGESTQDVIKNTSFWPDVRVSEFRRDMRMDGSVTDPRLRLALLTAIAEVNADLYEFREKRRAQGYASLADVPADVIDGESQRLMLYRRAVFCWAKANLVERYRDFDATGDGSKKAEDIETTLGELWRDVRWAESRLRDMPHMTVELI